MARIFLSHSSRDNDDAEAFSTWLAENGWEDVFLDIDPEHGLSPGERWQTLVSVDNLSTSSTYCSQSTTYLVTLACRARWRRGAVAEGILQRALGLQFRGYLSSNYQTLNSPEVFKPAKAVLQSLLRDLATAIDVQANK